MYPNYPIMGNEYAVPNTSYATPNNNDERFFWAPFVVGGLAGTALGYGIANNNQMNNTSYYPMIPMPIYSYPTYPTYSSTNYYY